MSEEHLMLDDDWHNEILNEHHSTIIECLGDPNHDSRGAKVVEISKTENGYKFKELCDEYYGVTLNQQQMERFIQELMELAGLK
jgi:hypothetical protein